MDVCEELFQSGCLLSMASWTLHSLQLWALRVIKIYLVKVLGFLQNLPRN